MRAVRRTLAALSASAAFVLAPLPCPAGVPERPKASGYPAQATLPGLALGAEFMVRSVAGPDRTAIVRDYVTVEVALYPAAALDVRSGQFTLRVNGKKPMLFAQTPQFVAAALKYPDWERRPELTASGGLGDAGVVLGRAPPVERFPGDPSARRGPQAPRAPEADGRGGYDAPPKMTPEELVVAAALDEGERRSPLAGYLYFAFRGKPGSIKTLELLYDGPAGKAVLKLR
jgi:hypothetical protein